MADGFFIPLGTDLANNRVFSDFTAGARGGGDSQIRDFFAAVGNAFAHPF